FFRLDERPIGHRRLPFAERNTRAGVERMKAVQREDFDGLAKLLIKAGHLFNLLWVRHKAGVQLLIASVNIGDHQHHELHRSSPWFLFWSCTPSRLAAPKFDTHPNYFFRAPGAAVLNTAAPVLVGSYSGLFDWLPGPPAPVRDAFVLCRSPDFGDRRASIDDGLQRRNRPYDPQSYPPYTIRSRTGPPMRHPIF